MNTLTNQQKTQNEYSRLTPEQVWQHPEAQQLIHTTREGDLKKDYLPRMIYADWLEDHGLSEHAQSIREDAQQNPEEWDWDNGHDWDRARNMADVGVLPKGYSNKKTWQMFKNPHQDYSDAVELRQFPGLHISWDGEFDPEGWVNMSPVGGGWIGFPGQRIREHLFSPYVGSDQSSDGFAQNHLDVFRPDNGYESNSRYHEAQKALSDDIAEASQKLWDRMNPFKE